MARPSAAYDTYFFVADPRPVDAEPDAELPWTDSVHAIIRPHAEAFSANISSARSMLQLPAMIDMAKHVEAAVRKRPLASAEELWSNLDPVRIGKELQALAKSSKPLRQAATELLLHGTVSAWSAFEVVVQDAFRAVVNASPTLAERLARAEGGKKFYADVRSLKLETLAQYGFDLSSRMGDVLLDIRAIDNVPSMKVVFRALCPGEEALLEALSERDLYELNLTRNLIVHRRGIVDDDYAASVSETFVGTKIHVSAEAVEHALSLVTRIGNVLVTALDRLLREQGVPPVVS